jgi:uncharacterized protein DUF3168
MSALQVSVDVEELLVQSLLRLDPEIAEIFGTPVRVYSRVPPEPDYPLAVVRRFGGALAFSHHLWLDRARIQCDVWGETKKATWRAADKVRSAIVAGQGVTYYPHGRISAVEETIAPHESPDPDSTRVHFVGEVLVTVRPLVVTADDGS